MIDIREALTRAAGQLAAHPDLLATAVQDATQLLMHALGVDRAALLAHRERMLTRDQLAEIQRLVERRLRFEPIQYILGTQEFYGLAFHVTEAVLIPRPETETLVEAVLARVSHEDVVRVVDVGTGSGAIAIALAKELPQASVTAIDLSRSALSVAGENAARLGVAGRIRFVLSDLLEAAAGDGPYDVIVSNPPYVPSGDAASLHPQVREFEPALALFAGADGMAVYERLIPQAATLLKPGGLLALEIGYGQRAAIARLLDAWNGVEFVEDLQGIPRVALARRRNTGAV